MRSAKFKMARVICVALGSCLTLLGRAAAVLILGVFMWTTNGVLLAETSTSLSGRWFVMHTAQEESQRLEAIDMASGDLGLLQRGKARKHLVERTTPPQSLTIEVEGSKVTIASGDTGLKLELGGSLIEIMGSDGKAHVSATMEGEQLIVVAKSGKGERTTAYRAEGDHLSVEVTLTGAKLAGPLKYVSTYVRTE